MVIFFHICIDIHLFQVQCLKIETYQYIFILSHSHELVLLFYDSFPPLLLQTSLLTDACNWKQNTIIILFAKHPKHFSICSTGSKKARRESCGKQWSLMIGGIYLRFDYTLRNIKFKMFADKIHFLNITISFLA